MRYFRDNDVIRSRSYLLLKSVNTLYIYESLHMNKTNLYIDRFTSSSPATEHPLVYVRLEHILLVRPL